uniref:Predicted protein n=1 Tax=Hordeum vulgare subsp. vulgare TaxID=112509 RepID=F2DKS6_HORVV|nr:predicted protein [Hordeum vulgare subsp. vulgare]
MTTSAALLRAKAWPHPRLPTSRPRLPESPHRPCI